MRLIFMREIKSRSNPKKTHRVRYIEDDFGNRFWRCDCLPFLFGKKNPCYHILEAQKIFFGKGGEKK
jgi:hypothetical protein